MKSLKQLYKIGVGPSSSENLHFANFYSVIVSRQVHSIRVRALGFDVEHNCYRAAAERLDNGNVRTVSLAC